MAEQKKYTKEELVELKADVLVKVAGGQGVPVAEEEIEWDWSQPSSEFCYKCNAYSRIEHWGNVNGRLALKEYCSICGEVLIGPVVF